MLYAYELIEHFIFGGKAVLKKKRLEQFFKKLKKSYAKEHGIFEHRLIRRKFQITFSPIKSASQPFWFLVCPTYVIIIPSDKSRNHSIGVSISSKLVAIEHCKQVRTKTSFEF